MEEVAQDARFAHVMKDPRFHKMPRKERKVKIDQRFNAMFKDKKFKLKYSVDKRGRPINLTSNDHLKKYYEMSSSEDSDVDEDKVSVEKVKKSDKKKKVSERKEKKAVEKEIKTKKNVEKISSKLKNDKQVVRTDTNKKQNLLNQDSGKKSKLGKKQSTVSVTPSGNNNDDDSVGMSSSSDDDDSDEDDDEGDDIDLSEDEEQSESDEESIPLKPVNGPDFSRGEGTVSSSDDDTDFDEEEGKEEISDSHWGEMDKDAPATDEITSRLAVCNMDWDRISAEDIYILLNSFKTTGAVIKCVKVYPSEFGLKRMEEEQRKGPAELVEKRGSDDEEEEDEKSNREKLRQYQLNRLKYYYAVVDCDSSKTASSIYDQCDGLEYESSSTRLDLRFIPEDMEFDQKPKSEVSDMPASYKPSLYVTSALNQSKVDLTWDEDDQERTAVTRRQFTEEELMDLDVQDYLASSGSDSENEDPYKGLIASDEGGAESDSADEEKSIEKYRKLLQGLEPGVSKDKKKDMEMEITWEPGLKEATETVVKKSAQKKEKMTPWDQYMEKKKEKKRQRREEKKNERLMKKQQNDEDPAEADDVLPAGVDMNDPYFAEELVETDSKESKKGKKKKHKFKEETDEDKQKKAELAMLMADEDDGKQHFNLKSIIEKESGKTDKKKKKNKRKLEEEDTTKQEDSFKVDTSDPRFEALFSSHLYNIDPSSSDYKKTKAMEEIMQEKLSRRKVKETSSENTKLHGRTANNASVAPSSERTANDASLSSLIKSVKAKTQFHQEKKKKKQKIS